MFLVKSSEVMIAFNPTDLPCPVAPATKKVGHLCQIESIRLVRDGSAQSYRQSVFGFLEFLGSDDTAHGDYLRIFGSALRYRSFLLRE